MSRRKQAKPIRHLDDGTAINGEVGENAVVTSAAGAASSSSDVEMNVTGTGGGSASSDLERSSSTSGGDHNESSAGPLVHDDNEEDHDDSEHQSSPVPKTVSQTNPGSLFIKRSMDEDYANNNNRSENDDNEDQDESRPIVEDDQRENEEEAMETDAEGGKENPLSSLLSRSNPAASLAALLPNTGSSSTSSNTPVSEQLKEQLKNIGMTISQLTQSITNNASPKNIQEMAVLQATLFSLQQQQLLQMQIISQLQNQKQYDDDDSKKSDPEGGLMTSSSASSIADLAKKMEMQNSIDEPKGLLDVSSTPLPPSIPSNKASILLSGLSKDSNSPLRPDFDLPLSSSASSTTSQKAPGSTTVSTSISSQILDPNAPSSLASSIIIHHDDTSDDKPVNSLELLQQKAQGILNNASQGLLANNLADFSVSKDKDYEKKGEPFFKHRCRYCGKVFGSDSALQIHVRSHTGERPYKCNICGNRFTTKGNLKVHFQRHSSKFPHVKMNPNLVPEHLDKFYPPLLQQIEEAEKKGLPLPNVNNPMAGMTPVIPPGMQLPNLPNLGNLGGLGNNQLGPLGLPPGLPRFPLPSGPPTPHQPKAPVSSTLSGSINSNRFSLPTEPLKREEMVGASRSRSRSPQSPLSEHRRERSLSREVSEVKKVDDETKREVSSDKQNKNSSIEEDLEEEPENLSHRPERTRSVSPPRHLPGDRSPRILSEKSSPAPRLFPFQFPGGPPIPTSSPILPAASSPNAPLLLPPNFDPAKDPNIYANLLPRPGSNDNAWESLIEVCKSSETAKLEQLVNNIEHKLSDPNECVICHRVLSCKSALQMHYRTHTGERPFKCRICGRAFTTKGNLKTHMGVHRAKPPMRMFHQCPVCHKKYANALVLQQHIKTHTGEPTELTQEQINAAEIKDFPPLPFSHSPFGGPLRLPAPGQGLFPGLPTSFAAAVGGLNSESQSPDIIDRDDRDSGDERDLSRPSSVSSSTSSLKNTSSLPTSLAALESLNKLSEQTSRSFGLVRPFFLDRPFPPVTSIPNTSTASVSHPEDLSSRQNRESSPLNGGKDDGRSSSPVSPPKYSPGPAGDDQNSMSPKSIGNKEARDAERNGDEDEPDRKSEEEDKPKGESPDPRSPRTSVALDLTPRSSSNSELPPIPMLPNLMPGLLPPPSSSMFPTSLLGAGVSSPSALSQLNALSNPAFSNPLGLSFPGMPSGVRPRGNTTCQICFKVFACNSALEIHIRSHTKERPFKCTVCDRGFSTKGNMKQHALTHKNRDSSSPHRQRDSENISVGSDNSRQSDFGKDEDSNTGERSESGLKRSPPDSEQALPLPKRPFGLAPVSDASLSPNFSQVATTSSTSTSSSLTTSTTVQNGANTPSNTNSSNNNNTKHLCHVCKKNFSSCSALQIHMRTHTGDRPFKCSVCGKAFTTKGNLKVHMGTHMWSSSQASRRGRRMSLELPHNAPPIPMTAKDSEFLQRRPELFFPYLPTQFNPPTCSQTNGLPRPPRISHASLPSSNNGNLDLFGQRHPLSPSSFPSPPSHGSALSTALFGAKKSARDFASPERRIQSPTSSSSKNESGNSRFDHEPWNWKLKDTAADQSGNRDDEVFDEDDEDDDKEKRETEVHKRSSPPPPPLPMNATSERLVA